ncbi:xylose isomerase [Acrocarpospora pleiomorpha]|uniref:Xylose isomerase n=1 Tax=Acrocarpospora pleiomorpha TaxID=90975 RepID=A0A5M3XS78_9ACTN|nr:sugar phosphate isomerase/epimerase [Acrocarpospora pleiomorpha]GES23902.1 xylose isomerase [Acrocarpospora pleiomorpha]
MSVTPPLWSTSTITFYKPQRLGSEDLPALVEVVGEDPQRFWDRLLDGVAASGARAVEFSIPPGDWATARHAYGGAAGVRRALARRGLAISSSYMTGHPISDAVNNSAERSRLRELVHDHASFIAELSGDLILQGPAKRALTEEGPSEHVAPEFRDAVADIVEDMARAARAGGTRYAIHTEAYSLVARDTDVDAMMARTDPELVLLCPDAGHITLDGGDAVSILRRHAARVPIAHWKDCAAPVSGDISTGHIRHGRMIESFRRAGHGIVDWPRFADEFIRNPTPRWAVAEVDFADAPVADVAEVLTFGRAVIDKSVGRAHG